MEEYRLAVDKQDFLLLNYSDMDFIVNRNQFSGSTSLDRVTQIESPFEFFNSTFRFNDQQILLFDCDAFLQREYACRSRGSSRLCLLMGMENFTDNGRPRIEAHIASNEDLSREFLGLIITSHSEIAELEIEGLWLSPSGIRKHLEGFGLNGCRFPGDDRIQYFIDLETIIINTLERKNT